MSAVGRVPPGFGRDAQGRLRIAGKTAEAQVQEAGGTPLFLYDGALVGARVAEFRTTMPDRLQLHYAVKANPFAPLLGQMAQLVDGFDVASMGEARLALAAGMDAARISFAGPGKRDAEIEFALAQGILLHVESAGELQRIGRAAQQSGQTARVALRVNPPFALKGSGMKMGGVASPFGVDAEQAAPLLAQMAQPPFRFEGFHVFAGSQNLDAQAIIASAAQTVALVAELAEGAGLTPLQVNLGGGLGVSYFATDPELDLPALATGLGAILADLPPVLANSRFVLELGRWLVAAAGVYLCRVIDVKTSGGQQFAVTDGGLHHQLAASGQFGTVVRRNYPVVNASRDAVVQPPVTVVGCLCTPLDRLAEQAPLAPPEVGDLIAVFLAGAYGRSASPENFLGHPPPFERLV